MKIATLIARILLGAGFTIFGMNILFPFLPQPPPVPGSLAAQFMAVAFPTGWMAMVGMFQLAGGLLVLSGRLTALGLLLLAPVLVNILAFHALLMGGEGIALGLILSLIEIFLIYSYRDNFAGIILPIAKSKSLKKE